MIAITNLNIIIIGITLQNGYGVCYVWSSGCRDIRTDSEKLTAESPKLQLSVGISRQPLLQT